MQKANYIGFDCETGGFSSEKNPITQIAMVAIDGDSLEEIERMEFYIKPYDNLYISQDALDVTGLKMHDINKGFDKKQAVKLIKEFASKISKNNQAQNRPILFAHNAKFDRGFLESLFQRCNDDLYKYFNETLICTQQWSKAYTGADVKLTLGECCKRVGIELVDAHKAMNDTVAMVKLFIHYIKILRGGGVTENKSKEIIKKRTKFQF
jgi:DNA polymerase-3 subunit alpha (Gram-positive type)